MSFSLDIEIEARASKHEILDILHEMHFEISQEIANEVRGNFPRSNIFLVFRWVPDSDEIAPKTEGADFAKDWRIGIRASFYYVMENYDKCSFDMHEFLNKLTERCDTYFLFSFEKEIVYAINDERGMQILRDF